VELLLIRHALPIRVDEIAGSAGPANPHLAPLGVQQAEALAGWLAAESIDAIWSSPMRRARETAAPVGALLDLPITVDEGLSEFDRDALSYIPIEELKAAGDPRWYQVPERPEHFVATVVEAVERIVAAHPGQRVAVVCHGGVVNAYAGHVLGIDDPLFFLPAYTSISRVLASGSGPRSIKSLNETAHVRDLLE
jgi:probable phosphoglycerate mutase